jgi:hypothetical protein
MVAPVVVGVLAGHPGPGSSKGSHTFIHTAAAAASLQRLRRLWALTPDAQGKHPHTSSHTHTHTHWHICIHIYTHADDAHRLMNTLGHDLTCYAYIHCTSQTHTSSPHEYSHIGLHTARISINTNTLWTNSKGTRTESSHIIFSHTYWTPRVKMLFHLIRSMSP